VTGFRGLAAAQRAGGITVLDVRRPLEWAASHIDGAVHIPLHELPGRMHELPGRPPAPVWVHCQAGYRAGVAASLLAAAGHQVILVDDDYDRAAAAGLPLIGTAARTAA
jgi:rhodanese-related sulfurtransferase